MRWKRYENNRDTSKEMLLPRESFASAAPVQNRKNPMIRRKYQVVTTAKGKGQFVSSCHCLGIPDLVV
jgi:hypothetical protein